LEDKTKFSFFEAKKRREENQINSGIQRDEDTKIERIRGAGLESKET